MYVYNQNPIEKNNGFSVKIFKKISEWFLNKKKKIKKKTEV